MCRLRRRGGKTSWKADLGEIPAFRQKEGCAKAFLIALLHPFRSFQQMTPVFDTDEKTPATASHPLGNGQTAGN